MTKFCPKIMTYEGIQFRGIHFEDNGEYDVQFELDLGERLPRWLVNALMARLCTSPLSDGSVVPISSASAPATPWAPEFTL